MKIKYALLESLITLSNKEIDFLLFVARFQDEYGNIKGIYYKEVCSACHLCKQTFYATLDSLQQKDIISYTRVSQDYDILIKNNDFPDKESYSEGYINVSRAVFYSNKFRRLRAKEKLLLLIFMRNTHNKANIYHLGTETFYKVYTELLKVTKKVLRSYLHTMREFFKVETKDGQYYISRQSPLLEPSEKILNNVNSETDQYLNHMARVNCRRNKVKNVSHETLTEIVKIIKQYKNIAIAQECNILNIISSCISFSVEKQKKNRNVNYKYVHKLVRIMLHLETGAVPTASL